MHVACRETSPKKAADWRIDHGMRDKPTRRGATNRRRTLATATSGRTDSNPWNRGGELLEGQPHIETQTSLAASQCEHA